ncbi:MAG TPA: molybdopterin molybdotransferase MoeA [Gammaproteobacteria bacterium]|nr:molybdopterin molybdotransferase MoeA [Gammaproteobacteria bacterium]
MSSKSDCMSDYDPDSLSVAEALRRIETDIAPLTESELLPLREGLGRVLAEDMFSPIDVPAHTNSAMDGYAVDSADLPAGGTNTLTVIGTAWAGKPFTGVLRAGQCVRIMTGAVIPDGADTIIMQERVERQDGAIQIGTDNKPGQNIRRAGEDIARGQIVLKAGKLLGPAELGVLASLGIAHVKVIRRLRVAFLATGDELRALGEPLQLGEIYDSNRYTLYGMLSRLGVQIIDLGIVRDRPEDIKTAFSEAARTADAVISSGGVSVGEADYVKEIVGSLGRVHFWKIAMKPGRPLAFGKLGETLFFGLPGNPVSAMTTFYQFVQPALQRLMGQTARQPLLIKLPTLSQLKKNPGRMEFQRGIAAIGENGQLAVSSTGEQGSGILSSMSKANCFIVLPAEAGTVAAGSLVDVQLFEGLI